MRNFLVLAALALVIGGCTSTATTIDRASLNDLQRLGAGWDRYFKIDWQPGQRDGKPIVSGRVESVYGATAWRVRLLVEAVDEKGQVVDQKVTWLGGNIPPFGTRYFEVPVQKWPHYRVSVFACDWIFDGPADLGRRVLQIST